MTIKIFVGNLQVESNRETESALRRLFEQFGKVVECDILTGKNFGFVHMQNEKEANVAIAALHGEEFFGGQINVERSDNQGKGKKPPRSGGGGGGGGGGGFRGRGGRGGFGRNDRGGSRGGRNFGGSDRRSGRYDPYSRNGRDSYPRDLFDMPHRDPYSRDSFARDSYARDLYARDAFARDVYGRDPYARSRLDDDSYGRPPPEYYDRSGRDAYLDRMLSRSAGAMDRELVSYPMPRASGFGKGAPV